MWESTEEKNTEEEGVEINGSRRAIKKRRSKSRRTGDKYREKEKVIKRVRKGEGREIER